MVNSKRAITAIRDIKIESFVAIVLGNIGWSLISRATDNDNLHRAAESNPDALVIASEDFYAEKLGISNSLLILNRHEALTAISLQELLLKVDDDAASDFTAPLTCEAELTLVATLDSGSGGTTSAIEIAHEKSRAGNRTLLLDFNVISPAISRYFDIQRINRRVTPTQFGFSIGELSDLKTFAEIAQEANSFEEVVIDLGKIPEKGYLISGSRLHEVLARWSFHSLSHLLSITRSDNDSLSRLATLHAALPHSAKISKSTTYLTSQVRLSPRERRAIEVLANEQIGGEIRHLPWEPRLASSARANRVPIAHLSRKNPLSDEIAALMKAESTKKR